LKNRLQPPDGDWSQTCLVFGIQTNIGTFPKNFGGKSSTYWVANPSRWSELPDVEPGDRARRAGGERGVPWTRSILPMRSTQRFSDSRQLKLYWRQPDQQTGGKAVT
jgi:hypothetical protein